MQLYLDMDGVLADFDTGYAQVFGTAHCKVKDNVDWKAIENTPNFYENLPPMPDFDELWEYVWFWNPIVITGVPWSVAEAPANKRAWCRKYLGEDTKVICCKSSEKSNYCQPGDILVDDWDKYKQLWLDKSGFWVTHVSAKNSIEELKKLGV